MEYKPYQYLTEEQKHEVESYIQKQGFNIGMNLHQLTQLLNKTWENENNITSEHLYYIFIDSVVYTEIKDLGYSKEDSKVVFKLLDNEVYTKDNQNYLTDLEDYSSYIKVLKEVKTLTIK